MIYSSALLRVAAIAAALTLSVGCSSGSRSSKSSSSTSAPTTSASSSTTSAQPNPGGSVVAITTAAAPVAAQLDTDAFVAFREQVSISDMVLPSDPALANRAFVVEDNGTIRILDISGTTPQLDRALPLLPAALPAGAATGALRIQDASIALTTTSGANAEGIAFFDPLAANTPNDVTWFDLTAMAATWPAGTLNSAGTDVSGSALPLTYTSDAVIAGGRLIFTSSNLDASFNNNPGTIGGFPIDMTTHQLSAGTIIQSSDFNPTGLSRMVTLQGELLLVTNTGAYGVPGASIDVIDPGTFRVVATIPFASGTPNGRVEVSTDGTRGYVASQSEAEVYVLDLEQIGLELGNQAKTTLPARNLGGFALPTNAAFNFVSSIALSHTGNYLYAVNFNESVLHVIDLANPGVGASVTGFARSGIPASYEGLANTLAVRPGVPGVDFQGPSIYVMTINLAAADQTVTNVSVALDTVTVDKH